MAAATCDDGEDGEEEDEGEEQMVANGLTTWKTANISQSESESVVAAHPSLPGSPVTSPAASS